ncbi:alanine racemase [Siminovitchia sp. FSL W7-1587]|uniref:alanine racemase n=1 Tax=Siminovitchia sp. FSL W7-1587 TaxID=2954699 RepID=UPI0030D0FAFE
MNEEIPFFRDTWTEIDLDALYDNVKMIRNALPRNTHMLAAVKANAYGHGALQVGLEALRAGAHGLVVALLDEALWLRKHGIEAPILVLGAIRPSDAGVAARYNISVPVFQTDWLEEASRSMKDGDVLKVHIKCDTGMGRIGLRRADELKEVEKMVSASDKFLFEGIFTHFATADQQEEGYYQQQLEKFKRFIDLLETVPTYIHAANSAAALCHHDSLFNTARIGIAIYGLSPSEERQFTPETSQVLSWHTKIVHVKKLQAGECVGYGACYKAREEEWIATLPVGYADGWLRKLEGQRVIIEDEFAPIVGRICMDQTMIRLPRYFPVGTEVTLIGGRQDLFISVDDIAQKLDTINYEVTCSINFRVPRVFKRGKQAVEIENKLSTRFL